MKESLIRLIGRFQRKIINQTEKEFGTTIFHNQAVAQKVLMQQHRNLASQHAARLPAFADVGFRAYSQFEEDGILLYIFSLIHPINRKCVEICAGDGRECMTTNLIINHGWWGYLFDGDERLVEAGKRFFANCRDTFLWQPRFNHAWMTAENVNECIRRAGVSGPIDLLSLDIDGMDYWVWKAISVVEPQVVVCETNHGIPADKALTVPYDPQFVCKSDVFVGASLAAMCKLGRAKGYRLVGTNRFGFNAFFLRKGVGEEFFPEVDPASCLNDPSSKSFREERWPEMRELKWQEV